MPLTLLYSTHPSRDQARQTADILLQRQLVACCNILPGMESHYVWETARTTAAECVMLSKTTQTLADAAMEAIVAAHPHDCPAVLQLPLSSANPAFAQWIAASVQTTR